ncbi:MAG: hypothetical protein ABIS10_01585 [Novosphingobium sp.]
MDEPTARIVSREALPLPQPARRAEAAQAVAITRTDFFIFDKPHSIRSTPIALPQFDDGFMTFADMEQRGSENVI